jgi:hypothetical protein
MAELRLSDDQRRVMAFFVDSPPEDEPGMLAAVEYLKATNEWIGETLKLGGKWNKHDAKLVLTMAEVLSRKAEELVTTPKFWDTVQNQLSMIHPGLKAR